MKSPLLARLFPSFYKQQPSDSSITCPNCWGIQQWEDNHITPQQSWQKSSSFIDRARNGFIRRFTQRHVDGVRKP